MEQAQLLQCEHALMERLYKDLIEGISTLNMATWDGNLSMTAAEDSRPGLSRDTNNETVFTKKNKLSK